MYCYSAEISCGVRQLCGVAGLYGYSEKEVLDFFKLSMLSENPIAAFLLFSDVVSRKGDNLSGGQLLAKVLEDRWPGSITATPVKINPNSGNRIVVWAWAKPPRFRLSDGGISKETREKWAKWMREIDF